MLSLAAASTAAPFSSSFKLLRRNPKPPRVSRLLCSSSPARDSGSDGDPQPVRANHGGARLDESVEVGPGKTRIDSWISSRIQGVSRARIQSSIRSGLVTVNGRTIDKVSCIIKEGDKISCTVSELQPLRAEPEDIPLDIVYEDAHVLVVNKRAHMDEHSHSHLAEQFKQHTIHRSYISLTSGIPSPVSGRIVIPIARDSSNRIRMAAVPALKNSKHARYAASRYKVVEIFAGGGSALVRWRLETGRTHQIRAHAKYLGVPLLGDELYGGTKNMALSLLKPRIPSSNHGHLARMISRLQRPCLHALSLGFTHPHTGEYLKFSCPPPDDFSEVLSMLRSFSEESAPNYETGVDV